MKNRQSGVTMIETLGAIAIATVLTMGLSAMVDTSIEDLEGHQAALHQSQVVGAARKYINANYDRLVTDSASGTVAVPLSELKAERFLPAGFSETNAYQQRLCVLVHQPVAGKLNALIASSGGKQIPERQIAKVAMEAGQGGGYVSTTNPTQARGASWELDTLPYRSVACNGTNVFIGNAANDGGRLVSNLFFDGPGQLASDFLYRNAVPGRPELNQMNTPIKLANAGLVKSGDACGTDAALAMDVDTRYLLACGVDGRWRMASSWRESVASFGALPTAGSTVGDVRMVTSLNRAFTYNGSSWSALAVNENGDMLVPRNLEVRGNVDVRGSIHADDHIGTDRDINVGWNVIAARDVRAGQNVTAGRDITARRDITAENMLYGVEGVEGRYVLGEEWVGGAEMTVWTRKNPMDECHIPVTMPDGRINYIWPIGTFVLDSNSVLLICGNDRRFRYQNNTFALAP